MTLTNAIRPQAENLLFVFEILFFLKLMITEPTKYQLIWLILKIISLDEDFHEKFFKLKVESTKNVTRFFIKQNCC